MTVERYLHLIAGNFVIFVFRSIASCLALGRADAKRIRDLFEAGLVVISDVPTAEVQLAEFRQQQIHAEGDVVMARAALNTTLGFSVNVPQRVPKGEREARSRDITRRIRPPLQEIAAWGARMKIAKVPPQDHLCCKRSSPKSTAPITHARSRARARSANSSRRVTRHAPCPVLVFPSRG